MCSFKNAQIDGSLFMAIAKGPSLVLTSNSIKNFQHFISSFRDLFRVCKFAIFRSKISEFFNLTRFILRGRYISENLKIRLFMKMSRMLFVVIDFNTLESTIEIFLSQI